MLDMEMALRKSKLDCIDCMDACAEEGGRPDCEHCWVKTAQDAMEYRIKRPMVVNPITDECKCINEHNIPENLRGKAPFCPFCGQKLNYK